MWISKKVLVSDEFVHSKSKETDAKYFTGYRIDEKLDHYSSQSHKWVDFSIKKPDTSSL